MKVLFLVSFIFVSPIVLSQDCETSFTKMLPYEQAREKVQELGIRNEREYSLMDKEKRKSLELPAKPREYYAKKGWVNAYDFFGTKILTYEQAREKVQELGIRNEREYSLMDNEKRKSLGLPASPREYYTNKGWVNTYDFFGTKILTYEQAKEKVQELGIKNEREYSLMGKEKRKSLELPASPREYYAKKGWVNAYDFFDTKKIKLLSYEQAKNLVSELGIRNEREYSLMGKEKRKSLELPAKPREYYANKGWVNAYDFFDTKKINLLSYEQARNLMSELGIRNVKQYKLIDKNKKEELKLPLSLEYYYQKTGEWINLKDFFGTNILSYKQAREKVQELGIRNEREYKLIDKNKKEELNLPLSLEYYYQKTGEWRGAKDFFGTNILSYKEAKKKMQELGIRNVKQYKLMDKEKRKSLELPASPREYYAKKGWVNAYDFFDTKKIKLLSYEQARNLMSELGIRNVKQYKLIDKNKKEELKLPLSLEHYYQKTGEWRGAYEFFGTNILSYKEAKKKVQELGIRNVKQYKLMDKNKKEELKLPLSLEYYYQKTGEWEGSQDFFEKKPKAKVKIKI